MGEVDRPTLGELLKPIHDATVASGVSAEEVETMADRALAEVRTDRRQASSGERT